MEMLSLRAEIPASIAWLWTQASSCWNSTKALLITLLLLALLLDYILFRKKNSRFPPGPAPLPFLGNLLLIDFRNPQATFKHLTKRYGMVSSLQAGGLNFVILSGFKIIKEAMGQKRRIISDRPFYPLMSLLGQKKNCGGIFLSTNSSGWKEQRKFCITTLTNFGMGKETLEQRVAEEARLLCSEFKSKKGSPFNPHILVNNAVSNIMCILAFGDRFEYNDETILKLMHLAENIMKILGRNIPQMFSPVSWAAYIPGPQHKIRKYFNDFSAIVKEIVNEHKKSWNPNFARDFIDAFLEKIEKAKGNPESTFNEDNLIKIILDLFLAGTETTSTTIRWGLLNMVLHPEIQKRIHEEIDEVLGREKLPTMEDQPNMPYTNAVIHEIQRYADIVPVTFPYKPCQDVEINNFVIPKELIGLATDNHSQGVENIGFMWHRVGSMVFNNLSSVLNDETMWEKPHQFYPEHFLDANGQFIMRENFLPFSAGPHACPGEQLAKVELFIFFTTLMQHFTFCIPENHPRPKEDRNFAITVTPSPFQICAIPR